MLTVATLHANTAVQRDPTRTVTLRRAYANQMKRRFNQLRREIRAAIRRGLLGDNGYLDSDLIRVFSEWLRGAYRRATEGDWQAPFLRSAFMRGLAQADAGIGEAGLNPLPTETLGIFLYQADFDRLSQKAVTDLWQIGDTLVSEVEAALAVATDRSNAALEALILKTVNRTGLNPATTMAVTAIVGAVAEATLSRLESYGVGVVAPVLEAFTTALNPCPICAALATRDNGHGPGVYAISEARGVVPVHLRCRCTWKPMVVGG